VQKMCTHVCKCKKMIPVETVPWIEGDNGSSGGGEFKYEIVDTL
jgi:hypothetical protein